MKNVKFIMSVIAMAGLFAGCNNDEGPSYNDLCKEALDAAPLLLNFSTGKEVLPSTHERSSSDGTSYLGLKEYIYRDYTLNVEWSFDNLDNWVISTYKQDPTYKKFIPIYKEQSYSTKVTCTISYETGSASTSWTFKTGVHEAPDLSQYEYITTESAATQHKASGSAFITTKKYYTFGYVTATYNPDDTYDLGSGVFIQDGNFGLELYDVSSTSKIKTDFINNGYDVGDLLFVGGTFSEYNGFLELKPTFIERANATNMIDNGNDNAPVTVAQPVVNELPDNAVFTFANYAQYEGSLMKISNCTYVSGEFTDKSGTHATVVFVKNSTAVTLSVNYHIGNEKQKALKALQSDWVQLETVVDLYGICSITSGAIEIVPIFGTNSVVVHTN